ncbi:hypothetical protein AAG570_010150 [Ranatra chinensis]|uniref:Threonylcarbamoyl-AMP synthase n=1 Tax=Ranatra chinensis TaxID=642074 RepID=A0ABD0Z3U5_9HEMI
MTNVIRISHNAVSYAVKLLNEGEVIALPTDTVYGLAASCHSPEAIGRLYDIKGRDFQKPIAICVGRVNDIHIWADTSTVVEGLLEELLPGPVTVLLYRSERLNQKLNPNFGKVGVRIPDSDFIRRVVVSLSSAIALTSANISGDPSALKVCEFKHLWPKASAVFDGGDLGSCDKLRAGSTVIDLTIPGKYTVIREGSAKRRETKVKESLTSHLMASIEEVQLEHAEAEHLPIKSSEATNSLCTILEAIFLHGLKQTLANRISLAIADPDKRPEPDFWSPLMVYSHRDVINQINKMSQITNDVGRCRAWLRLALNESSFISYIVLILKQNNGLNPYYKKSAYLRDTERLSGAKTFIEGLSSIHFNLSTNSSVLNVWTNIPLLLAGIWTAPMKAFPIVTATDVAKTLTATDNITNKEDTQSIIPVASQDILLDEDEALKIILGTPLEGSPMNSRTNLDQIESKSASESMQEILKSEVEIKDKSAITGLKETCAIDSSTVTQNKDIGTSDISELKETVLKMSSTNISNTEMKSEDEETVPKTPITNVESYHSLLKTYTPASVLTYKSSDLDDIIEKFESHPSMPPSSVVPDLDPQFNFQTVNLGYEVISETTSLSVDAPVSNFLLECKKMVENFGKIMQERGLDSQKYVCKKCKQLIGIELNKAKVCALTGSYYCTNCFLGTEWIIPARILHNWDFSRYEVCSKAANFLNEVQYHPILNIRKINPRLYLYIEDMAIVQKLRLQLNLLRGYLMTCRDPILKTIQKQVWPREYLYEHVHLYSIADLVEISSGALAQFLQKLIKTSQDHVSSCCLCSQKGFICELCRNPKAVYPFELDTSFRVYIKSFSLRRKFLVIFINWLSTFV